MSAVLEQDGVDAPLPAESWGETEPACRSRRTSGPQDFDACERTQPGMSSRLYAKGGALVPSEHHIGAFHD
ncbi:hypothetical protein OOT09_11190 [Streptomyces sp. NBC_00199]|nr:hypothetical protein [Streptomyces sp. NBC_00199]